MKKSSEKDVLLRKLGIRHFDELIHDQPKEWLIKHFSKGADEYPVNVALLFRNIIWQMRQRVVSGKKPPLEELLRTFWYMYIKPTLTRAGALSTTADQYVQLIDTLVNMVKDWNLMTYKDIGFRDATPSHRKVGVHSNIILFAEKIGHLNFLSEIADKYNISIISFGGQPSVLNTEYFVNDIKAQGVDIRKSFYLFSIVDYDPSGWIIRDAFIDNLNHYGVKHTRTIDLVHPDMLTPEETKLSRYKIPAKKSMLVKNNQWLKEVRKRQYSNQVYLEETTKKGRILYGLEAESISEKRLSEELEQVMVPLIGKSEDLLKIYELQQLNKAIIDLMIHRML